MQKNITYHMNEQANLKNSIKNKKDIHHQPYTDPLGAQMENEKCHGILQDAVFNNSESWLERYRKLVCGNASTGFLIKVELITGLLSGLPGAVGFALRKYFYPFIIKQMGAGVIFGRNISIRHPQHIYIGNNCLIADNCELSASGADGAIIIGNNVTIGRNTFIRAKGGKIVIGDDSSIGSRSNLAARNADITIGKNHIMAAFSYIGTGTHQYERGDIPISRQKHISRPVKIEEDVWIGLRATILPGSTIRTGSVIGACSLVNGEIGAYQVVAGTPARKIKNRDHDHIEEDSSIC